MGGQAGRCGAVPPGDPSALGGRQPFSVIVRPEAGTSHLLLQLPLQSWPCPRCLVRQLCMESATSMQKFGQMRVQRGLRFNARCCGACQCAGGVMRLRQPGTLSLGTCPGCGQQRRVVLPGEVLLLEGQAPCISALQVNFKPTEDLESLLQALLPSMSGLLQLGLTGRIGGEHSLVLTWESVCCQAQVPAKMCCSYCMQSVFEAGTMLWSWLPVTAHVCTCPLLPT